MKWYKKKKFWLISAVIVALAVGGWLVFGRAGDQIETVKVKKTDLIQTVSLTGRVRPESEVELAFRQSGQVARINVAVGQTIRRGGVIAELAATEPRLAVSNAELNLADTRLALDKMLASTQTNLLQSQLNKIYEDGLVASAPVYNDLPDILKALDNIYFGNDLKSSTDIDNNLEYYLEVVDNYTSRFNEVPDRAKRDYETIQRRYQSAFADYQAARRGGADDVRESAILSTRDLLEQTANLIKAGQDLIQFFQDKSVTDHWTPEQPTVIAKQLGDLIAYRETISGHLTKLIEITNTLAAQKDKLTDEGFDLDGQRLRIKRAENDLAEARDRLADYYLAATFDGIIASSDLKLGVWVSAGLPVAKLQSVNKFKIEADVPEADIAKIKVGQTGAVTLDAYGSDTGFSVIVSKIDPAEILIEGIPTYRVTLHFTNADQRIKSGMTANVEVATAKKEGVLAVPARAVTTTGNKKTVRLLINDKLITKTVTTGLRDSAGNIEIIKGLKAGDQVVTYAPNSSQ